MRTVVEIDDGTRYKVSAVIAEAATMTESEADVDRD